LPAGAGPQSRSVRSTPTRGGCYGSGSRPGSTGRTRNSPTIGTPTRVTDAPETRFARSADGTPLAYQLSGAGPLQLVFCHWAPPIDLLSDDPGFVRLRRRLGTFSRTLWFDPRGMGASEGDQRGTRAGAIYDGDLIALLDAVGFERPAIVGNGQLGPA